jgi:glycosyltransferase involved in cell wall biosynthesis
MELVRGLIALGHKAHIVSVDKDIHSNTCETVSPGMSIHRVACQSGRIGGYLARMRIYRVIRKLAMERRIDIVEVPDFEGWCAGWPQLPIPVIARLHGSASYFAAEMHAPLSSSLRFLERRAIQRADHIISVSRYTADRSEEVFGFPLSATIIYNSVALPDEDRTKTEYASSDLVCYTGTLVEKKGVFSLAQGWPLIKQRRPNAQLLMIGRDGGHCGRSSVEVIRDLAGIHANSIHCIGHLSKPDLETRLVTADIAVFPSYSETFALAPMEAMALCVPTIYTTRASGSELVRHNVDAWLCDPDNVDGLADQVVTLLQSQALRRRLGLAGRRRVSESFSHTASVQNNIGFYERCIAGSEISHAAAANRP